MGMAQTLVTIDELVDMAQGLGIFPQAAARIQEAANDPRASDANLAKAIQIDPMATARLLKLSNSAAIGGARHITDIREAITRLGYHAAKNLAIALVMGDKMIQQQPLGRHLWEHSVRTGIALSCLARFIRHVHTPSALTAGLLHDVGLLAQGGVARQGMGIRLDAGGGGHGLADGDDSAPLGESGAEFGAKFGVEFADNRIRP